MDFKFCFLPEEDGCGAHLSAQGVDASSVGVNVDASSGDLTNTAKESEAEEVVFSKTSYSSKKNVAAHTTAQISTTDGSIVKYTLQTDKPVVTDTGSHTDLVPGVYEGGRKTWECSFILLDHLSELSPNVFMERKILEVGCGSGLPGLYCVLRGAEVTFQDYNKDVIEEVTVPNVCLTCNENSEIIHKCKFFYGDWRHFSELLSVRKLRYDIILASEVIYNIESYEKLHNLFATAATDDGVIYVASKYHYFGVGGGVESFTEHVKEAGVFNMETVFTTDKNLRCVILKLTKKYCARGDGG